MSDKLTILGLVQDSIADNRGIDSGLRCTVAMMLKWAERDATDERLPYALREKTLVDLAEAKEATRLIAERDAMIAAKIAAGPAGFKVGKTVRIKEAQIDWRGEEAPHVGLVGVVARLDKYPWPEPPEGKTAVRFKNVDVGYCEDEDDDDRNHVIYYVWTFSLEEVPEGTPSVPKEIKTWPANPAPEGHRWAILYESDGNPNAELGGHNCSCHGEMIEYTEKLFGRVEAVPIDANREHWQTRWDILA